MTLVVMELNQCYHRSFCVVDIVALTCVLLLLLSYFCITDIVHDVLYLATVIFTKKDFTMCMYSVTVSTLTGSWVEVLVAFFLFVTLIH